MRGYDAPPPDKNQAGAAYAKVGLITFFGFSDIYLKNILVVSRKRKRDTA